MTQPALKILGLARRGLGFLALVWFLAGELHAFWVLRQFDNANHAVMFWIDSIIPMQFRLMAYRAGAGCYQDPGFLLPAGFMMLLILWLAWRKALPADRN